MVKVKTLKIMKAHYQEEYMRMFHRGFDRPKRTKVANHSMNRWFKNKWRKYVKELMRYEED